MPSRKSRKSRRQKPKYFLHRVRLDRGGYDANGRYYGSGAPLFEYEAADGSASYRFRARDREDAETRLVFNPRTRKVNGIREKTYYTEKDPHLYRDGLEIHRIPEGDE